MTVTSLQKVLSHTMKDYEEPKRIMEINPHAVPRRTAL